MTKEVFGDLIVRLGIKYKLFVILLSASLLIITCMFVFIRISFEHGLISYMDKMQLNHLETMCQILGESYAQEGSWTFLEADPEIWDSIQRYTFRKWRKLERRAHRSHGMNDTKTPAAGGAFDGSEPRMPHDDKHPRFTLLDRDRKILYGLMDETLSPRLMPVIVGTETVGYLGMSHPKSVIQEEELRFFQRQTRVFLMIALSMVLVSIIVAVWTAYYLERPITVLTQGTRMLASGDFKTRIPVKSRDELGQLSEDFNTLAKTLEENEADRKKWVEDIAHDLRTPLTLLSGELEALEDGVRELTPDTIQRLQSDIRHLIRLVNDLNELSRTDKGSLAYKMRTTDLPPLIRGVTDRYDDALRSQGIQLEYAGDDRGDCLVFADPERLNQLFANIIRNSLDYTEPGGHLKISIEARDNNVRVDIEDSKPGVPNESLGRLFDRMYRVEGSRNRRFGGSGLGLSICKNIVEAHGGCVSAYHSSLGGLGIRIVLPLLIGEGSDKKS